MDIAVRVSEMSHAVRLKVGSVLVKNDNILAYGFNGAPTGYENVCEDDEGNTMPHILHSEENVILKAARSGNSVEGATLYITHSPCVRCARLVAQSGISRVVYINEYRDPMGKELLEGCGVHVDHHIMPI